MQIVIPGNPIPKLRPRFGSKKTYDVQKDTKRFYQAIITSEIKRKIIRRDKKEMAEMYKIAKSSNFHLSIFFYMKIPRSAKEKMPCNKKPDIDNLIKLILDCMSGLVFDDDRLVTSICAKKSYSKKPKTVIEIEAL